MSVLFYYMLKHMLKVIACVLPPPNMWDLKQVWWTSGAVYKEFHVSSNFQWSDQIFVQKY